MACHRLSALACVMTVAAVATGCVSSVNGSAVTATGGPPAGTVDIALLDTGNYPTKPSAPMGLAGPPEQGALIESQRMASYVTGPWEADPALVDQSLDSAVMLWRNAAIAFTFGDQVAAIVERHNYVAGFMAVRSDREDNRTLTNAVLRFSTDADAAAAVSELAGVPLGALPGDPPGQPVDIPGHPQARALGGTRVEPINGPRTNVESFTQRGPYVLVQQAKSRDGAGLADLVAKTLDLQGPLIDRFVPTGAAQLADVPIDPTGLLAKTLPVAPADANPLQRTVYEPRGALHLSNDPLIRDAQFRDAGVTLMAFTDVDVYETPDSEHAERLVAAEVKDPDVVESKPVDGVANLPQSTCTEEKVTMLTSGPPRTFFTCKAVADRYAIFAMSPQERDVRQMTAAQYVMLMAP